ncbi:MULTISPECIES: hypothetical protein [Rhizobium]|jgi:GNAT superfamily N-acetyltransferase|uniref:hypothetical protein n=1 Tax=Rhizobium TaxID=379 RepID=UPI000B340149|nr:MULTISPECIES: hypothetical protein [Rhizobium]
MEEIVIEPLGDHPRGAFCCGVDRIDNFFRNNALKSHKAYAQRVFVASKHGDKTPVGFYALTIMTFRPGMSEAADKKFGRFDAIPSIYLTMIARDKGASKGLGTHMMLDAFKRSLEVREHVGVYALTLHAYNDDVRSIYEKLGFQVFADPGQDQQDSKDETKRYKAMFISLSDVAVTFAEVENES